MLTMRIIGIHDGHNASVCLFENGRIKFTIQEERLNKIKNYDGFPYLALEETLKRNGLTINDIDVFAVSSIHMPAHKTKRELLKMYENSSKLTTKVKWLLKETPIKSLHRTIRKKERLQEIQKANIPPDKVIFVEHHTCHAYTAYWGSPFRNKKVLVFTNDGAGDDLCGTVSIFHEDGRMERIQEIPLSESIGQLYATITFLLGMVPLEHEYKLMGMDPYAPPSGTDKSYKALKTLYEELGENGNLKRSKGTPHMFTILSTVEKLLKYHRFDWISAGIQKLLEEFLTNWIRYWIRETGIKTIALSGGVFMNVKANKKIIEMDEVEEIFVFPSCGDETNSIGACYYAYEQAMRKFGRKIDIEPLGPFYLGGDFSNDYIEDFLRNYKFKERVEIEYYEDIEKKVAELLAKGEVVARFKGRMEFGARALGNRSILANPLDWDTINRINKMIKKRDFWMPFAPSILGEKAEEYLVKPKKVKAPYMILTFDTKPEKRTKMRAAIHPYDGTARPQEVYKEWNEDYWRLIKYFEDITGEAVILNTSFNLHGYPIVYTPKDAVFVFENSGLKFLALGNFLIMKV